MVAAVDMVQEVRCCGKTSGRERFRSSGSSEFFRSFTLSGYGKAFIDSPASTSFFIVGIPFSMQFNHIQSYQWVFPVGLSAALTDVVSWWGIKFVAPSFEYVSMFCGVLFSVTYVWMLIGLLRVLLFPEVIWASDKDAPQRLAARREIAQAARHKEGDY